MPLSCGDFNCMTTYLCLQYSLIHRLETNKLRNVAKFFGHLMGSDAISWDVLQVCAVHGAA